MAGRAKSGVVLVPSITCPHCAEAFAPEKLKFIARSPTLNFDHKLPDGQMRRFSPSIYSFQGDAIDFGGEVCSETACPKCHLKVPRLLAMRPMLSFSVFGSPSSGKSYLLGSMCRMLRERLGACGLRFDDVDVESNEILLDYERRLFQQPSPGHWVYLEKTQELGAWYSDVWFGPRTDPKTGAELLRNRKTYPKPFMMRVDPQENHPNALDSSSGRVICLFDNAGEHFQVGNDRYNNVTRHLKESCGLVFVYDPTQDPKFREACRERSSDRQFRDVKVDTQDVLYGNVMNRLLSLRSMLPTERVKVPLVVALTKYDAWRFLLDERGGLPPPYQKFQTGGGQDISLFASDAIDVVSRRCRDLLLRVTPHFVSTIESRCEPDGIRYMPVSATGGPSAGKTRSEDWPFAPSPAPPDGYDYFLQKDIRPEWAEVPLLTLIRMAAPELLPGEIAGLR
jgi:hypothetical protein